MATFIRESLELTVSVVGNNGNKKHLNRNKISIYNQSFN